LLLTLLQTARSVKADLESIPALCSQILAEITKYNSTIANTFSLVVSIELQQNNAIKEEHALMLLPDLLDNSLFNDLVLVQLILENLPYNSMNYHQQLQLFCFLCSNTKLNSSAIRITVDKIMTQLLHTILSNLNITLNRLHKITMDDWLAEEVANKSVNVMLDIVDAHSNYYTHSRIRSTN